MRKISLDFKNRMLAIQTDVQGEVEFMWPDIQKPMLLKYIPKNLYMNGDNFTLDFDENKLIINKSVDYDSSEEQVYTTNMFIPNKTYIIDGLGDKFYEVLDDLGYAEVQWDERKMDYLNTVEFLSGLNK